MGWFLGLWILVGPAAWWKSGDLRLKYESLRAPVPSNVGVLKLLGILTCVLMVVAGIIAVGAAIFAVAIISRGHVN